MWFTWHQVGGVERHLFVLTEHRCYVRIEDHVANLLERELVLRPRLRTRTTVGPAAQVVMQSSPAVLAELVAVHPALLGCQSTFAEDRTWLRSAEGKTTVCAGAGLGADLGGVQGVKIVVQLVSRVHGLDVEAPAGWVPVPDVVHLHSSTGRQAWLDTASRPRGPALTKAGHANKCHCVLSAARSSCARLHAPVLHTQPTRGAVQLCS